MKFLLSLFSAGIFLSSLQAAGWDPEDVTFDPSIKETIAHGSSRIGDPSPFNQDGFEPVGFTHLQAKADPNSGVLVWVSLIVPFVPDKMDKMGGASMFLSIDQAESLKAFLVESIKQADTKERKEIGVISDNPAYETWKVFVDGSTDNPVVLHRKRGEEIEQFRFAINPAKKMLDALNHFIAEAKKLVEVGE